MKHHKRSSRLSAVAVVLGLCASVDAYAIDYTVNLTATGGGTLTGTISTDGTLGALVTGNFTGFSLTWNYPAGNAQLTLSSADASLSVDDPDGGQELQATASSLFMLNNPASASTSFQLQRLGQNSLTFVVRGQGLATDPFSPSTPPQALLGGNGVHGGIASALAFFPNSDTQFTIGTAAAVPEPGTYALMGLGLLGLGAAVRRQRKAA